MEDVPLEYESRFSRSKADLGHYESLPFTIDVPKGTRLIAIRPYRTSLTMSKQVGAILDSYLTAGLIGHSECHWASYLVAVPKKNGSIRITVNYNRPHSVIIVGKWPLWCIYEVMVSRGNGKNLSTFDLSSSLFQIIIHPESTGFTAFATPRDLYRWFLMPQCHAAAPSVFAPFMQRVTRTPSVSTCTSMMQPLTTRILNATSIPFAVTFHALKSTTSS